MTQGDRADFKGPLGGFGLPRRRAGRPHRRPNWAGSAEVDRAACAGGGAGPAPVPRSRRSHPHGSLRHGVFHRLQQQYEQFAYRSCISEEEWNSAGACSPAPYWRTSPRARASSLTFAARRDHRATVCSPPAAQPRPRTGSLICDVSRAQTQPLSRETWPKIAPADCCAPHWSMPCALQPPSIGITAPVMNDAAGVPRK